MPMTLSVKSPRIVLSALVALLVLFVGCGPSKALQKKQATAGRELAEAYMEEGKNRQALRELEKAQIQNPGDHLLQNDLGLVYLALGEPAKAVEPFQKAVKLNPSFSAAINNLGTAYLALREWDKAKPLFESLAHDLVYATPYLPLHNLGFVAYNQGDYELALKRYQEALDLKPDFAQSWRGMGKTYMAMGRYAEATERLQKAIELAPNFAEAYMDLAEAFLALGRKTEALDALDQVIQMLPDTPLAREAQKKRVELGE